MTVAEAIKAYRIKQGLTQVQLAKRVNKSVRMIRHYESGTTIPPIPVLENIFNISLHEHIYKLIVN